MFWSIKKLVFFRALHPYAPVISKIKSVMHDIYVRLNHVLRKADNCAYYLANLGACIIRSDRISDQSIRGRLAQLNWVLPC